MLRRMADWTGRLQTARDWIASLGALWVPILAPATVGAGYLTGALSLIPQMAWPYQVSIYAGSAVFAGWLLVVLAVRYRDRTLPDPEWQKRANVLLARKTELWWRVQSDTSTTMPATIGQPLERYLRDVNWLLRWHAARRGLIDATAISRRNAEQDWRGSTLYLLEMSQGAMQDAMDENARRPGQLSPRTSTRDRTGPPPSRAS